MTSRRLAIIESTAEVGGAQLSLLPVAAVLAREHAVTAYLPGAGPLAAALEGVGVQVASGFELPEILRGMSGSYGSEASIPQALVAAAGHQRRLVRALRQLRPSVVYLNGFRAQVGATMSARATGARVVWHIRDFRRPGLLGAAWSVLAPAVSSVIANSYATARQPGLRHVARRVDTIYNGIDLEQFVPLPPPARPVIGMAAHLSPWKGHARFLRLVARLRDDVPDLHGRIAGGDIYTTAGHRGYADSLRRQITELGLERSCTIERVTPEDMPRWLGGLTALVHCPQRPEPFGRVLAEALATGLPVVASDEGGATEVIGHAGLLCAPNDDAMLIGLTRRLLVDSDLRIRLALAGRQRAEAMFDERAYAERVAQHLR